MCRVFGDAQIAGQSRVYEDARVFGSGFIHGTAQVCGTAQVGGTAQVFGSAKVFGDAMVYGSAKVYGNAKITGEARIFGDVEIRGFALIESIRHWFSFTLGSETMSVYRSARPEGYEINIEGQDASIDLLDDVLGRFAMKTIESNFDLASRAKPAPTGLRR